MSLMPYRNVLALPGVRNLIVLGFLSRIPATAVGITLTLHVVNVLHRGYAAAGLVTAAYTVGAAIGSPMIGRMIDRRGVRPALALTTLGQAACWLVAPYLPYQPLIAVAVLGGLLAVPVWGIVRQSLSAQVPEAHRRSAFALDSMSVEVSFMVGPPMAVLLATGLPAGVGLDVLATASFLVGLLLYLMNPATRAPHETRAAVAPSRRTWLHARVLALLLAASAATLILSATDLTIVATLRQVHATSWTGLVFALWCGYSLLGGLVFGAMRRTVPVPALVAAMGLLTVPVGLAPGWQLLCVALFPAGVLCAPTITATNDMLSRVVPAESRGEAMGLLGSALTAGASLGSPAAGLIIDHAGASWAYVAAGGAGALVAALSFPAYRRVPAIPEPVSVHA
jgi:MFS family permease